jgi:hypothetical protein
MPHHDRVLVFLFSITERLISFSRVSFAFIPERWMLVPDLNLRHALLLLSTLLRFNQIIGTGGAIALAPLISNRKTKKRKEGKSSESRNARLTTSPFQAQFRNTEGISLSSFPKRGSSFCGETFPSQETMSHSGKSPTVR